MGLGQGAVIASHPFSLLLVRTLCQAKRALPARSYFQAASPAGRCRPPLHLETATSPRSIPPAPLRPPAPPLLLALLLACPTQPQPRQAELPLPPPQSSHTHGQAAAVRSGRLMQAQAPAPLPGHPYGRLRACHSLLQGPRLLRSMLLPGRRPGIMHASGTSTSSRWVSIYVICISKL